MSGEEQRSFDVVVIGAGPAGEVIAGRLAEADLDVAIVEQELVGGECSFWACMPSKALLRPAHALAEVRRIPGAAEAVTGELDVAAVLERRDEVIHDLDDSSMEPWLDDRGIELIRQTGRLSGEREVTLGDGSRLRAERAVVIAVGSGAKVPPIEGMEDVSAWSNREITTAKEVPGSLLVLGGGPVGCEMAQAWRTLGAEVTLIARSAQLLPREEQYAGEALAEALADLGIELRLQAEATESRLDGEETVLTLEDGEELRAERLLLATGRDPRTDDLGLESVGLEAGGYIEVDDRLRAGGHEWLYAVGDVNGRALLTHAGKYQARVAADVILGEDARVRTDGPEVGPPRVCFTDPQIAAVGLTLDAATERGIDARAVDAKTSGTAGASFVGRETGGTTRLVIDRDRQVIVGATFVGPDVAELLHAATIAVAAELPIASLAHAIPSFPTRSEVWLNLLEQLGV